MNDYLWVNKYGLCALYHRERPLDKDLGFEDYLMWPEWVQLHSAWHSAHLAGTDSLISGVYADWLTEHLSDLRSVTGTCAYLPKMIERLRLSFHSETATK